MKNFLLSIILFLCIATNVNAEKIKRIFDGEQNARITIIVYESLTCSHCANFHKDVFPLLKKDYLDTGLAKIEFRNFPLDIAALNASKVAHCKNDGSSSLLNKLFDSQQEWAKGKTIEEINKNLKKILDAENFNLDIDKCIKNQKIEDFVLNDRIEGIKNFKVNATPTIIINNKKFEKSLNYKNLKKSLEKLI